MFPLYKLATIHGSDGCKSTLFTLSDLAESFLLISNLSGCGQNFRFMVVRSDLNTIYKKPNIL